MEVVRNVRKHGWCGVEQVVVPVLALIKLAEIAS